MGLLGWLLGPAVPPVSRRDTERARVEKLRRDRAPDGIALLVDSAYLPHGGTDVLEVAIGPAGGTARRTRRRGDGTVVEREIPLAAETWNALGPEIARAFDLADGPQVVIDGRVAWLSVADGARSHAVVMHPPEGPALAMLERFSSLYPVTEPGLPREEASRS